jgi:fumarate hydratase subunit alpha
VPGDKLTLTVAPKGFGSENMSRLKMFTPAASREDIVRFVADTVKEAGGNPCPPVVLGVGIGGDFELCAKLAKEALCRDVSVRNPDPYYARLEQEMLDAVNATGVGPQRDRPGGEYRDLSNPYSRAAGGGQHGLPCDQA